MGGAKLRYRLRVLSILFVVGLSGIYVACHGEERALKASRFKSQGTVWLQVVPKAGTSMDNSRLLIGERKIEPGGHAPERSLVFDITGLSSPSLCNASLQVGQEVWGLEIAECPFLVHLWKNLVAPYFLSFRIVLGLLLVFFIVRQLISEYRLVARVRLKQKDAAPVSESALAPPVDEQSDLEDLRSFLEGEFREIKESIRKIAAPGTVKTPQTRVSKTEEDPDRLSSSLELSSAVQRHWSSTRDWRDLLQNLPAGLAVYEIQDVASMLGTTAYSTVPIQLKAADRHSTGPVLLGSKSSRDEPVLLFPLTEKSFSNDNSLSVLQGLFDITPPLQSKTGFRFVHADEPCQLRPEGGSYRREKKGSIRTDQNPSATKRSSRTASLQMAVEKPVETVAPVPSIDLTAIGAIVREEVRRELSREDSTRRRLGAQLEAVVRELRNLEARPVEPSARVVESVELAEPVEPREVELQEEKVEIRKSSPIVREVAETTPRGSTLRRGRRSRSVDLAEEVLGRLSLQGISRTGSEIEYSDDLKRLKNEIGRVIGQSEDCRVAFFQVSSSQQNQRDVVLEEVAINSETGKFKPLHKASHVTSAWQVLLGLYDLDNEAPGQECVLLFPWSMERGAPVVFNLLVDDRGMTTHASFVSCVQPAVLSLHEEGTYRVQRKMIVRALQTT